MKKIIQILILGILIWSCSDTSQKKVIDKGGTRVETKAKTQSNELAKKLLNENVRLNCVVSPASGNLLKIAGFLKRKGYLYTSGKKNSDLIFDYRNEETFEIVESITFADCQYIEFSFRKIKPVKGHYYPKFRMLEFCFESEEKASEYLRKLNYITNKQVKNYSYTLQHKQRLIYVQTGVNMYGFIIKGFKKAFETIIKKAK